jgi:cytochrome c oxidase assembly factor CtaG/Fe-S-cluster-containing hydrogenase component 2
VPDNLTQAILQSWTIPLVPTIGVILAALIYLRGWRMARVTRPLELPAWRMGCFLAGLASFWLALASPLDALDQFLLVAHMTQHLILMSVAPPLIVLGAPVVPMLRGMPRALVRDDLSAWMNSKAFHGVQAVVTHPVFAWLAMNISFLLWHMPAAYDLALRNNTVHELEHASFFFFALPFWWFVLQPWPSRYRWSRWMILPYLMSADVVNTALSGYLVFGGNVIYSTYRNAPRIFGITAQMDQTAAGAEMWVLGSLLFWIPLMVIVLQLLSPRRQRMRQAAQQAAARQQKVKMPPAFDLLQVPVVGRVLRSRFGRAGLQSLTLLLMAAIILDGTRDTPIAMLNLGGSLLWNILRPLNLLLFFVAGNLFCMACPFTLPRELARFFGLGKLRWPEWLKNKWPATVLLLIFFWAYEHFALWNSPRDTAMVLLGYVLAVFVIDSIFRGANFCKYVCPIGQFNFVSSLVSPLDLGVKSQSTCSSCSTRDCIRGNETQRGCELQLYLPTKQGNMDCTLCMDCVKACPHDNIALRVLPPMRDLVEDPRRSSLRRFSRRLDIAVMVLLLTVSSIFNAGVMIAPVVDRLSDFEAAHPFFASGAGSLALAALVFIVLLAASWTFAKVLQLFSSEKSVRAVFCRFALALLPLGLAMWAAHLLFHMATAASSFTPTLAHAWHAMTGSAHQPAMSAMAGMANMPGMNMSGMGAMTMVSKPIQLMLIPGAQGLNLFHLQIWILDLGLLLTLYAGWRLVRQMSSSVRSAVAMLTLWTLSSGLFYAICLWIYTQPMEMRGMGM